MAEEAQIESEEAAAAAAAAAGSSSGSVEPQLTTRGATADRLAAMGEKETAAAAAAPAAEGSKQATMAKAQAASADTPAKAS